MSRFSDMALNNVPYVKMDDILKIQAFAMDKTIRKLASFEEAKDEEYRYWQSISPEERLAAGHQMSVEGYRAYGYSADGRELKTVAVRLQCEQR
jgi:hypothetical protein